MKKPSPTRRRSAKPAPARPARAPAGERTPRAAALTYPDLLAIVRLIESGSRFSEFRLRSGDIEVEVHRGNGQFPAERRESGPASNDASAAAPAGGPAKKGARPHAQVPAGAHVIRSPMVGTFYRSPEPGAKPFVEVGSRVERDTIVCIIEVMKLMNSVPAGVSGVVTHVLADNAHMVEYGQPLIAIEPK
jgi:acetyl-CoA carboxylase biotin carboxyl carrier protein